MAYAVPQTDPDPDPGPTLVSALAFTALGGQPPFAPRRLERFVRGARIATLAYVRRDGRPHQVPTWYAYRDGDLVMSTVTGSPKHTALQREPRVSMTIQDDRPPYRAVVLEGTVELGPLDADDPTVAGLSMRYLGRAGAAVYDRLTAETYAATGLTKVTFRPVAARGFDNTAALNVVTLAFVRVRDRLPIPKAWL